MSANLTSNIASKINSSFVTASPTMNATINAAKNTMMNSAKNVTKNATKNDTMNTMKNVARNIKNGATDAFNTMSSDIKGPITESINASFKNNSSVNSVSAISIPIIILLGILTVAFIIILIFRTQIAIGLEVLAGQFTNMFNTPAVEPALPEFIVEEENKLEKLLPGRKEVFNVAQDKYTYTDAEPLCKAFGAELATYDQVKDAWEKGADWCNYGWVKGQAALYPTQKETYDKLQAGPEDQRMACGVPGVNGGFFDNPELKFGVNCYGTKPSENEADARKIMANNDNLTPGALEYDRKVNKSKTQMGQIPVNPFKPGVWE